VSFAPTVVPVAIAVPLRLIVNEAGVLVVLATIISVTMVVVDDGTV
jgi:hypothetical protein